ncbi:transposase [Streptomyces chromofuscus]|uniref:transposase n=1 Tax=Streptomyces chromofuscus TaxID=42881 RepID=UPI0035712383
MDTWRVRACSCSWSFSHAHRAGLTGPYCSAGPTGERGRPVRPLGSGARPARSPWPPLRLSALVARPHRVSWPVPARSPRSRNGSARSLCAPAGFPASPPPRSPHRAAPFARPTRRRRPGPGNRRLLTARAAPAGPGLRAIAVDGKALRGSRTHVTGRVTLLAAVDHTGHVLAQRQTADKSNETPAFRYLLDSVDPTGTVITADALHTQHAHGTYLREARSPLHHPGQGQPSRPLRPHPPPALARDHPRPLRSNPGPPRPEKPAAEDLHLAHLDYRDARQTPHVVRTVDFASGKVTIGRVYLITSLPPGAVTGAQHADWIRGPGKIEFFCTTSVTARSARTTPRSKPAVSRASWPACATSPSASIVRTATPNISAALRHTRD